MDSTSKVILFFIVCIAAGLAIGAGISKFNMDKKVAVVPIAQNPVVSDDSENPAAPAATDSVQTAATPAPQVAAPVAIAKPKPYACPVAPKGETDQWLAPVGPDYGVGDSYIPANLVILDKYVPTSTSTMCLNASAAVHLEAMEDAMNAAGLKILVSSAYRPASYQETLRDNSESNRNTTTNPYPLVALAGHSEHQLGMAVDLTAPPNYTLDDFVNTPEYAWLQAHSYEYGFIESYPIGSEPITGYSTESWHYRYVGIPNALAIHNEDITTYQFLKNLAEQPLPNPLLQGEGVEH